MSKLAKIRLLMLGMMAGVTINMLINPEARGPGVFALVQLLTFLTLSAIFKKGRLK